MRLKIKNLNLALETLTSNEFSLYIYIAQRSNIKGLMQDLKMTDAKEQIEFSKQGFYDALYSLEKKGLIHINYSKNIHFDILLNDNSFENEKDTSDPYLNLNYDFLNTKIFHSLKLAIKKFILRLLSFKGKRKLSKDSLKRYKVYYIINELKEFFDIEEIENGVFYFSMSFNFLKQHGNIFFCHIKHKIKTFANRHKLSYAPKDLKDAINVLTNNRKYVSIINYALNELVRQKKHLNPKLLNHIITTHKKAIHA